VTRDLIALYLCGSDCQSFLSVASRQVGLSQDMRTRRPLWVAIGTAQPLRRKIGRFIRRLACPAPRRFSAFTTFFRFSLAAIPLQLRDFSQRRGAAARSSLVNG
jgi:hypothetical protein